jgi:ribosomal protein S21
MNIYVGNLSGEMTEEELRQTFEAFGEVSSAKIISDKFTGESKGFGFVEMPNKDEGDKAVEGLNGKDLKGQSLTVNEARPRREERRGGGGRRFASNPEGAQPTEVFVNNDVEKALRVLKKKLAEDGDHRRLKERKHFTPRNQRKRKKAVRARRKRR